MEKRMVRFGNARVLQNGPLGPSGQDASGCVVAAQNIEWIVPIPGGCAVGIEGGIVLGVPSNVETVSAAAGLDFRADAPLAPPALALVPDAPPDAPPADAPPADQPPQDGAASA
jgi:hypothetical protein